MSRSRVGCLVRFLPAIVWASLIFFYHYYIAWVMAPAAQTEHWFGDYWDKLVHMSFYGILCFLLLWADRWPRQARAIFFFLLTGMYGAFDEYRQSFLPDRHASLIDLMADLFGAFLSLMLVLTVRLWIENARSWQPNLR